MTLEVSQIKASSEAALESKSATPDFSDVYKKLSNNTSAQDQAKERAAVNEVLHKQFPELDLIGQAVVKAADGKDKEALIVFDKKTSNLQTRDAQNFSVMATQDLSSNLKESEATPEMASQGIASEFDKQIATKQPGVNVEPGTKERPNSTVDSKTTVQPEASSKASTDQVKNVYVVKEGDNLWNIARTQLETAGTKKETVSNASIRSYVDQIVERNKDQIKDEDLIYPDQKFILPEIKTVKTEVKPEQNSELKPNLNPNPNPNPELKTNPKTQKPNDAPEQLKPVVPKQTNPEADLFSDKRNNIPGEQPLTENPGQIPENTTVPAANGYEDMAKYFGMPGTKENPTLGYYNAEKNATLLRQNFGTIDIDKDLYLGKAEIEQFAEKQKLEKGEKSDEYKFAASVASNFDVLSSTISDEKTGTKPGETAGISAEDLKQLEFVQSQYENQFAARAYAKENFDKIAAAGEEPKDLLSETDVEAYLDQRIKENASLAEMKILVGLKELVANVDTSGENNIKKGDIDVRFADENIRVDNRPYKAIKAEVPVTTTTVQPPVPQPEITVIPEANSQGSSIAPPPDSDFQL